jgi:hypothetical protein
MVFPAMVERCSAQLPLRLTNKAALVGTTTSSLPSMSQRACCHRSRPSAPHSRDLSGLDAVAEQRDAADEGRLEPCGSIVVGTVIVNEGRVVRPSQLIASVRQTKGDSDDRASRGVRG